MQGKIQLPAIKGIIGNWVYYQTVIPFNEVVDRIDNDHSIREYQSLDDYLQRDLSSRSKKIANYLLRENTRFFNSAIIGLFGGDPNWYSFDFAPSAIPEMSLNDHILNSIGILQLSGDEKLFSIDGQHRIDGIKQALKEQKGKFEFDELPVIIIAHSDTRQGKIRTRRLFSEINTKAIKVSGLDDLITNESNPIDINTRRLYAEFVPFDKDVFIALNSQPTINVEAKEFTSILNIREVNKILYDGVFKFQDVRPEDNVIDELYNISYNFWQEAVTNIPQYNSLMISKKSVVSDFRNKNAGGSMLLRPIGIEILAGAYKYWQSEKGETTTFWGEFLKIDDSLDGIYWQDVLWNNAKKTMISKSSSKFLREYTKYLLGLEHDGEYVTTEYSKLKGTSEVELVQLPEKP